MIGRTMGRYRIVAKIGEGGMGSVWKAEDPLLGRTIALKFLPESLAASEDARRRFLREAQAASSLHHPGIATVFDAGESDGKIYIAFHCVDGETIRDRISSGPLAVDESCRITVSACEALGYAHAQGILHRDVTSRNIMVARDGSVVIVDFGLALPEEASRLTRTGTAMGTAAYMAPEVISGKPADRRSDIYGLGVLLYEMLTGCLPHSAERAEALQYLVVHSDPAEPKSLRSELSAGLNAVVLKALARDPRERYQSAEELAADLERTLSGSELTNLQKWARRRATRRRRSLRHRALTLGAAALALVAILWIAKLPPFGSRQALTSVAVLPLSDFTGPPGPRDWMIHGIGESLVVKLTKLGNLRVTPWPTSRRFSNAAVSVSDIAHKLNVDAVIVGTLIQVKDRMQVSLSLIGADSDSLYWSEQFDESDFFKLQGELAVGVAAGIKGKLGAREKEELAKAPTRNQDAYKCLQNGSIAMQKETGEGDNQALAMFETAVQLDSSLAEAYIGIGAINSHRFYSGGQGGAKSLDIAEENYRRALALDSTLANARAGLIRVFWERGQSEECLKQGRALRHRDDVDALLARGQAYFLGGQPDRAERLFERTLELDPENRTAYWFLVMSHSWANHDEQAIESADDFFARFGEDAEVLRWVGLCYRRLGDLDAARVHLERAEELSGGEVGAIELPMLYMELGDSLKALRQLMEEIGRLKGSLDAYPDNFRMRSALAVIYAYLGDREKFRQEEERLLAERYQGERFRDVAMSHLQVGEGARTLELLKQNARKGTDDFYFLEGSTFLPTSGGSREIQALKDFPGKAECLSELKQLHDRLVAEYGHDD